MVLMGAKANGVVVRDYRRIDEAGVRLRVQPRRQKRGAAHKRAEQEYRRSPKGRAAKARRRARKNRAVVPLTPAEQQRIVALYAEAARRTAETGIAHHVDHDVPLALGGLHHPDNLLVVPASINLAKGARYGSTLEFILS